jgi:hypothetical protein
MQQPLDQPASRVSTTSPGEALADRLRDTPGLVSLVAEAEATWRARAVAAGEPADAAKPGWRTFEDSFPTFHEFTNRPR